MFAGKVSKLILPDAVSAIEYGAFIPESLLSATTICLGSGDQVSPSYSACFEPPGEQTAFMNGDCTTLTVAGCKLCLMHQYGLNSSVINAEAYCVENAKKVPSFEMTKCFWKPLENFSDGNFLQNQFLQSVYEKYKDISICQTLTSETTTAQSTGSSSNDVHSDTDLTTISADIAMHTMEPKWQPSDFVNLDRNVFQHFEEEQGLSSWPIAKSYTLSAYIIYLMILA